MRKQDPLPMEGTFIVFEGIDGAGKSSLASLLAERIPREVVLTAEPSDGWVADALKRACEEGDPILESLLFVADRAHHSKRIRKWLDEGKVVICDRYYASTLAYQSASLGEEMMDWLRAINEKVIIEPDVTILLDIDPPISLARITDRGVTNKFEEIEYLHKVRKAYLKVAKEEGFIIIDASLPLKEVELQVLNALRKVLGLF